MAFPERITTARLLLHRWDHDRHFGALAAINAEPAAVTYLNDGIPYTHEESARQSARFATHWSTHGYGLCAVEIRATGEVIGFVGVAHPLWFPPYAHELEAGWRLHPSHWGRGYATEAALATISLAFSTLRPPRIIACIDPGNAPSIAVASRVGMTLDGTVPHPQRAGELLIWHTRIPPPGTERRADTRR